MASEYIPSTTNRLSHIAFYREYFCLSGTDNLIKIYDSNNGQLVKVLPQEFDGVEFVGWNGTEYRVLVSMPMVYDLVSELDYLVVSDGKRMAITFNQLLTVDWECEMSVHQQLNRDLFNQVYVAGDKLVRVRFVVDNQKLYTEQIIKVCQLISLLEYGEQHIQKIKGWWYRFCWRWTGICRIWNLSVVIWRSTCLILLLVISFLNFLKISG